MKILSLEQNSEEWFELRKGKITGTKLKDVVTKRGNSFKIGVYQLLADRIAAEPDNEDPRDRGLRLESEALDLWEKKNDKKLVRGNVWVSDLNPNIMFSPDGYTEDLKICADAKCLASASHLQIVIEDKIPNEYLDQVIQAFVVNDKLEKFCLVAYDDRIKSVPYHEVWVNREDVAEQIDKMKEYQISLLKQLDEWTERFTF